MLEIFFVWLMVVISSYYVVYLDKGSKLVILCSLTISYRGSELVFFFFCCSVVYYFVWVLFLCIYGNFDNVVLDILDVIFTIVDW